MYSGKYLQNYGILKKLTDTNYRLIVIRTYAQTGFEEKKFIAKGQGGNEEKLKNSISRAKNTVFELAICNEWEYFVTFTLDKEKYDRYELKKFQKDLTRFIRNYRNYYNEELKYLLIPEMHLDGAWHMHGFIKGLHIDKLKPFTLDMVIPYKIRKRLEKGKKVYYWQAYADKFGYTDIEVIENNEAAAKYITKYVTEDMDKTVTALESNIYYCSQGLKRAKVIKKDILKKPLEEPDFQNEYVAIKQYLDEESAKILFGE